MFHNGTIAIQAGGNSHRMGQDKGLISLAGQTMIEHVIQAVEHLCDELFITTNNCAMYAMLGLRLVEDRVPHAGALSGIQTALRAASGEYVVIVGCDMPFVNAPLLTHQLERALESQAAVVMPHWQGRYQPFHAVYHRDRCLPILQDVLNGQNHSVTHFYNQLLVLPIHATDITRFDPTGQCFFNVNTPADLKQAEALLSPG